MGECGGRTRDTSDACRDTGNQTTLTFVAAQGWSMTPFLKPGDRLVIRALPASRLRIGDIVAYDDPDHGSLICHRLVKKHMAAEGIRLHTQGDASPTFSGPISGHHVRGKVIALYREGQVVVLASPFRVLLHYGIVYGHPVIRWARKIKWSMMRSFSTPVAFAPFARRIIQARGAFLFERSPERAKQACPERRVEGSKDGVENLNVHVEETR